MKTAGRRRGNLRRRLSEQRPSYQRALITTLATTCAWVLAGALGTDPIVTTILCIITLRRSLHASLTEGILQLTGTVIGVSVALLSAHVLGAGAVSVALVVISAIVTSRLLRLGDDGSITIAISALIVLGPGTTLGAVEHRITGTALGVIVALVFSYWALPSTPIGRTQSLIASMAADAGQLLHDIAAGALPLPGTDDAAQWLERARRLTVGTDKLRAQAEESVRYAAWSPLASNEDADAIFARYIAIEHCVVQLRTIARTYYDVAVKQTALAPDIAKAIVDSLHDAADTLERKARLVSTDPSATIEAETMNRLRGSISHASSLLARYQGGTDETLVVGSLLAGLVRMADSLGLDSPAIDQVPTPLVTSSPAEGVIDAVSAPKFRRRR